MSVLRPTGDKVLIRPMPQDEQTKGGILLAPQYQQPSGCAKVLSVGGRVKSVKRGAIVYYSWINTQEIENNGQIFRLIHEGNLIAVKTNEEAEQPEVPSLELSSAVD